MKFKGLIFIVLLHSQISFGDILNKPCWSIENRISRPNLLKGMQTKIETRVRENSESYANEIEAIHLKSENANIASIYFLNLRGKRINTSRITNVTLDPSLGHPSQLVQLLRSFLTQMESVKILEIQIPETIYNEELSVLRNSHLAFHIFSASGLKFLKKEARQEITGGESPTIQYYLQFQRG